MAETVHLFLKVNGTAVSGDSTQTSLNRDGSIECVYYEQGVQTARDQSSGMATGRRTYQPLLIRKRVDKSSPLLAKAMSTNAACEATFKFFRPSPTGDGTTQQYYTVDIAKARLASIKHFVPDVTDATTQALAPMEDVTFVFHTITWTYVDGGVSHQDTWDANT